MMTALSPILEAFFTTQANRLFALERGGVVI